MKRVLVLDACQRSALAVTRSLGSHGVAIITADETTSALAGNSRYSECYVSYPSPRLYQDQFISAVTEICNENDISIIFPMTELTAGILLDHRTEIPDVILPFPDVDSVNALADKYALMQLAESLQLPIPATHYYESCSTLPASPENMSYPLVLKPGKSWILNNDEWLHTSVRFAEHAEAASSILKNDAAFSAYRFLLQECVPGKGEGIFALYNKGKPLAFFAHKRLREKPPRGGVSVLSESIITDAKLLGYARTLLDQVNWHGIAMVEFKVADNGEAYLMEVNTRFWGSLQLAIDAGVDFPWLLYRLACGDTVEPITTYKIGNRLRWLLGDVDSLYLTLRDKNFTVHHKLLALINFLTPHPFKTRHEVNRFIDLKPFWWEFKQYLKDLVKASS